MLCSWQFIDVLLILFLLVKVMYLILENLGQKSIREKFKILSSFTTYYLSCHFAVFSCSLFSVHIK